MEAASGARDSVEAVLDDALTDDALTDDALTDEWVRKPPGRLGYQRDAILAVVMIGCSTVSLILHEVTGLFGHPGSPWLSVLWVLINAGSLAFRRRWPAVVALVSAASFVAGQLLVVSDPLFSNINLFIALYTLGAWGRNRLRATVVRAVIIAGMFLWLFIALFLAVTQPTTLPQLSRAGALSPFAAFGLIQVLTNLLYFGGAFYFGTTAYQSARQRAALEARTAELVLERERSAAQAVTLERVRIARELHDVVAHHVSVMGVQAGAARLVLDRDPAQAVRSLASIESSARTAVDELHKILIALRDESAMSAAATGTGGPADAASLGASTRNVDQLPSLVADAQRSGLPTVFSVVGSPRPVPDTIGLSIYRIAQESLTNTLKHAGAGASVDMRLRFLPGAVELEIGDDGTRTSLGTASSPAAGSGLGQVGMRERVAAVGGRIEIGPKPRGGYVVRARFPTPPVSS